MALKTNELCSKWAVLDRRSSPGEKGRETGWLFSLSSPYFSKQPKVSVRPVLHEKNVSNIYFNSNE
jgi:hypothetical protein